MIIFTKKTFNNSVSKIGGFLENQLLIVTHKVIEQDTGNIFFLVINEKYGTTKLNKIFNENDKILVKNYKNNSIRNYPLYFFQEKEIIKFFNTNMFKFI